MGTLYEDRCIFISRSIVLRIRSVSDKFVFIFIKFRPENCVLYGVEKYGSARQATDENIIRRMRFTNWITKTTKTQVQYVMLIAFPRQHFFLTWTSLHVTLPLLLLCKSSRTSVHFITIFHVMFIINSSYFQCG